MASVEVMGPRKLKKTQFSKPSAENLKPAYEKITRSLRKIGLTRYDELVDFLSDMGPDREKKTAADEIVNTPGAAKVLEKIMLEDNDLDVAAALFTSLLRHKNGVELTQKQTVLFKMLLKNYDDLSADFDRMGTRSGAILIDILLDGKTEYSRLSAAHLLERAKISNDDMKRLLMELNTIDEEHVRAKLISVCQGHLVLIE